MTRTMQDSVNAAALQPGQNLYAGYVDGRYANIPAILKRFPRVRVVRITVLGSNAADVVDIETGDCTPLSGVASIKRGTAHTAYCNLSTLAAVLRQIDAQKLPRSTPIWTAHYTGQAHLCGTACFAGYDLPWHPNVVATQYADKGPHVENVDRSVVADHWPGVDPKPAPVLTVPWWWHRPLSAGMRGADVFAAKRRMSRLGYKGMSLSPSYGPAIVGAVKRFQSSHGLPATGVIDRATAHAIRTA